MANISALLEIIRTAHLGRDMRQALHDSIDAVNDDVETCGQTLNVSSNKLQLKRGSNVLSEVTMPSGNVNSVNGQTGDVELDADDISDSSTTNKFVTDTEKQTWNGKSQVSVTQIKSSGEKIATINVNGTDTDLYASAGGGGGGGAVDSVNGKTGDVVLTASDVGALADNTPIPSDLSDLSDVDTSGVTDGQILKYNGTSGKFLPSNESGGGTTDYSDLTNKPQINGVTLSGNKTSADLGISGGGSRKILFLSDSYGHPDQADSNNKTFVDYIKEYLGMTSSNFIDLHTSSSGFVGDDNPVITWEVRWEYIIKDNLATIGNPNEITDIVFCGGANDIKWTTAQIETAMASCMSYCKTTFPNAKLSVASVGVIFTDSSMLARSQGQLEVYRKCSKYGASYLHNTEYILSNTTLLKSDHVHPNSDGVLALAEYVTDALLNGSCSVSYNYKITPTTILDNGTLNMFVRIDNEDLTIYGLAGCILYQKDNTSGSIGNDISFGTFANLPFIGRGIAIPVQIRVDGHDIYQAWLYNSGTWTNNTLELRLWNISHNTITYSNSIEIFGYGTFPNVANYLWQTS